MENLDKKMGGCTCYMHGSMCGCHGGKHHLIKMILKLIIVMLIFGFGFKLGVITGSIHGAYSERGGYENTDRGGWGMMNRYYTNAPTPNTNVTPAPVK